jgi:membrane protein
MPNQNYWAGMCLSIAETHLTRELIMDPLNDGRPAQEKFRWSWTQIRGLLANTYREWSAVEASRMGASLAYYTVLSLAPLLIVVVAVAGMVFGRQAAQGALLGQIQDLVGKQGAEAIQSILQQAGQNKSTGMLASIVGFLTLLFGASSVALELRSAMNKIWAHKEAEGVSGFIKERSYAIALVFGAGFLLLVSLVISTVLASLDKFFGNLLPMPLWAAEGLNAIVSILMIAGVLGAIFKFLPSVPLTWRDVSIGALFTAILFTVGKTLIGIYLGRASVGSVYGAAGSLVVVLVWIYYSAQILFFGAEFIRVYSTQCGSQPAGSPQQALLPSPVSRPPVAQPTAPPRAPLTGSFIESLGALVGSAAGLAMAIVALFRGSDRRMD